MTYPVLLALVPRQGVGVVRNPERKTVLGGKGRRIIINHGLTDDHPLHSTIDLLTSKPNPYIRSGRLEEAGGSPFFSTKTSRAVMHHARRLGGEP